MGLTHWSSLLCKREKPSILRKLLELWTQRKKTQYEATAVFKKFSYRPTAIDVIFPCRTENQFQRPFKKLQSTLLYVFNTLNVSFFLFHFPLQYSRKTRGDFISYQLTSSPTLQLTFLHFVGHYSFCTNVMLILLGVLTLHLYLTMD